MGFRFRKSVKIVPGVKVNFSKKGASLSVGRRGASVNINRKGVRSTVGLPGTGLSYSSYKAHNKRRRSTDNLPQPKRSRPMLLIGIALLLLIFIGMFGS